MRYENAAVPAGLAWSSPFARWQGSLAEVPGLDLAAAVTGEALARRGFDPQQLSGVVLGWTVPQPDIFYGAPTLSGRIGAPGISGAMVSQACATSVASLHLAVANVELGAGTQLVVTTDRTSNGPQVIYPAPSATGGAPLSFNWVIDSFGCDPWAGTSMLEAGDTVAAECGVSKADLDEVTVLRYEQYERSLADERRFQLRCLVPVSVRLGRREVHLDADEGVRPLDPDAVAKLSPVSPGGVHSHANQTHPADGCAGAVVTSLVRARELSVGEGVARIRSSGFARAAKSHMPEAPVPAALSALADAGLSIADVDAVTTHNPFAVNDLYFARRTGFPLERMNAYGCSLVFGHPQAPTGLRSIVELIEELRLRGGGIGLYTGCAAGDTGAAVVVEVTD